MFDKGHATLEDLTFKYSYKLEQFLDEPV